MSIEKRKKVLFYREICVLTYRLTTMSLLGSCGDLEVTFGACNNLFLSICVRNKIGRKLNKIFSKKLKKGIDKCKIT
jgi:hypothetical protein